MNLDAVDMFTPEFQEDPYPVYERLRRESPVYVEPRHGVHWLTRHEDVLNVLRDHEAFTSTQGPGPLPSPGGIPVLASTDPPYHDQLRALVSRAFTPRRVAEMEPRIREMAAEHVRSLGEHFDIVPDLSIPIPVRVIAEMLGVEPERQGDFRRWSDAFVGLLENPPNETMVSTSQELIQYFQDLCARRRAEPKDDMISALVQAEIDGRGLDEIEISGFLIMLLVAGNETTTNLISNQMHILSQRPDLWKQLREDRSLVPAALEETVRFDSPVQNLGRQTTREVTLAGLKLPADTRVVASYAAANRDPDVFEDPEAYRLDRKDSRHLGFGFGVHFCLGAGLARLEGKIVLEALLDRFERIEPGRDTPKRLHSTVIRGFEALSLRGVAA